MVLDTQGTAPQPTLKLNDGRIAPQLGLGVWRTAPEETAGIVRFALQAGYRSVDTAAVYRNETEQRGRREQYDLADEVTEHPVRCGFGAQQRAIFAVGGDGRDGAREAPVRDCHAQDARQHHRHER